MQYVVIRYPHEDDEFGDKDPFRIVGPFDTREAAESYGRKTRHTHGDWDALPISSPSPTDDPPVDPPVFDEET